MNFRQKKRALQTQHATIDISMRKRANVPHRSIALRIAATRMRKNTLFLMNNTIQGRYSIPEYLPKNQLKNILLCVSGMIRPYSTQKNTNNKNKKLFPVAVSLCTMPSFGRGLLLFHPTRLQRKELYLNSIVISSYSLKPFV